MTDKPRPEAMRLENEALRGDKPSSFPAAEREMGPDGKEWAKTLAGEVHAEMMMAHADGHHGMAPWFYGWALRNAFVAGAEWQEKRLALPLAIRDDRAVAWARTGFSMNFVWGSHRPPNDTSNPNGWIPLYSQATIDTLTAERDRLKARVEELQKALEPFARVAEHDIGDDEADAERYQIMQRHNRAPHLTVGDLRAARQALKGEDA